jgi:hypothetical protein
MPIKCTITIDEDFDDQNERFLKVSVSQDPMHVRQNTNGVSWKIVNNATTRETVKLRNFKNLTTPANPDDPCTNVTPRRKRRVNGQASGFIDVDVQGIAGDRHKYSIHVGNVVALDPELEVQP